jgi:hypothetical protein
VNHPLVKVIIGRTSPAKKIGAQASGKLNSATADDPSRIGVSTQPPLRQADESNVFIRNGERQLGVLLVAADGIAMV